MRFSAAALLVSAALLLSVSLPFIRPAAFTIYYDSACSFEAQTLSSVYGEACPPTLECVNGKSNNSTQWECCDSKGQTTLSLSSWKSNENCPSNVKTSSLATSTGPTGGCNPITLVSGSNTYNFYVQGSCTSTVKNSDELSLLGNLRQVWLDNKRQ